MSIQSIALFCGSAEGKNPIYTQLAYEFGRQCAIRNITLYYGGGSIGLMGAAAKGVMENGGKVIGVAPTFFKQGVVLAEEITEMIYVQTMSERKQLLESQSDAFVTMPGGYGTMDELFEIITDAQLGMHNKPVAIFNPNGFYDLLIKQLELYREEGFLRDFHHKLLIHANTLDALFEGITNYQNSNNQAWLQAIRNK